MKLSLRFVLPLTIILSIIAYCLVPLTEKLTLKWFVRDLNIRADLITNTINESLQSYIVQGQKNKVAILFEKFSQDERLFAMGFCSKDGTFLIKTKLFPKQIQCDFSTPPHSLVELINGPVHFASRPLYQNGLLLGELILIHDMSFVQRRSDTTKKYILILFLSLLIIVSLVTVLIAQLSWRGWISGIRSLLRGDNLFGSNTQSQPSEIKPIAKDLRLLIKDIEKDRKIRDELHISWTPKALKELLQRELAGDEILILSNRQPYIHNRKFDGIEIQVPASGLVTALEPIMRACSGTWIAHGSGSADRDVVDDQDHVQVPPENPCYQIRRVWLTIEEEQGYYYGFANEGLWPLCHIAHTRPIFRSQDWNYYLKVNQKFAEAVIKESKTNDPVILIQDYHFALAPKMIKEKLPNATIITFWHIPWPNPEAFGICPWREEILEGLLGSSIIGFHTRFHCNNFKETIDRFLECRIDKESSTISYKKKLTAVNAYPISIEWPPRWMKDQKTIFECRNTIREKNDIGLSVKIGIGVDRLDYTKGILERFYAIERFLELYPEWVGKFVFIQIAAPTRSKISEYKHFEEEVRSLADTINNKYAKNNYRPIKLHIQHHSPQLVFEYFRGSELCIISSLHDGMNLVAKEYISSRDDEQGVLILSQFTGAAKELPESIIINPYNIDQCAHGIATALQMPLAEQKERMRSMRGLVQEFNVYRWAGRMLIDAARIRQQNRLITRLKNNSIPFFHKE